MQTGAKKGVRRPTLEEVEQAMVTVLSSFPHEDHATLNLLGVFREGWICCNSFQFVMSGSHEVAEQYQFYVCKKEKIPRKSLVCISVFLMAFAVCFLSLIHI